MKVVAYTEQVGDMDKMLAKDQKIQEESQQFPDRVPTQISDEHFTKTGERFRIYDGTEEQVTNLCARWFPEAKWKFVLAFEASKAMEAVEKLNK